MSYGDYPDLARVKKILVIKLRHLGDVLLSGPVFKALKTRFPEAQIDGYVYTESFPMLENHPSIHHLIGYDQKWKKLKWWRRIFKEGQLLGKIRHERYDLVINLTEGDRGALAAMVSQASIRVGFTPKGWLQKKLYTHLVKQGLSLRHEVEKNLDALRRIGIFPSLEDRELFLHVSSDYRQKMSSYAPFVLIHPTSRWRFKCWTIDKMREVAKMLLARGERVVFTSGPDKGELEMVEKITQGLDVINLSGKITLQELGALIDLSQLLICVDSVPFHMASALKKRVIALFGPSSEISWGPWRNPNAQIVTQPFSCRPCHQDGCGGSKVSDCLTTLPVEAVLNAAL